jgi:hypothetical protein
VCGVTRCGCIWALRLPFFGLAVTVGRHAHPRFGYLSDADDFDSEHIAYALGSFPGARR